MENNLERNDGFSLLKLLKENLLLIVVITMVISIIGSLFCVFYVKPEYKVSRSAILRTELESSSLETETNNAALAFLVIGQLEYYFTAPDYIKLANKKYKERNANAEGEILASDINVEYKEDSLIFTISYKDSDKKVAISKLIAVFETSKDYFEDHVSPYKIKLIPTDNAGTHEGRFVVVKNSGTTKYVLLCLLAGLVVAFATVLIKASLDNTIRDKDELEEITGVSVLAYIAKR